MKNFQIIFLGIFIAAAIFGILVFSGAIPLGGKGDTPGALGTVVLWGTFPSDTILKPMEDFSKANPTFTVKYVQKSSDTFDSDLLEALSTDTGPDMFFLPDNLALHYANKIFAIPYASYPVDTFKNTFAGAGEVFLTSKGILAFPMSIDPLVMYYNRNILDANNIVYPPATWNDFTDMISILTKKDNSNKIVKSMVALGQFSNVTNAKDIIISLFMQTGNPIVTEKQGNFIPTLDSQITTSDLPPVLKFYTDFADPNSPLYSWNRSFANSNDAFSREDLAFYFGFASEFPSLVNKNPNQNFFVTGVPQIKGANFKATASRVTGIAVTSSSKNVNTAFTAANLLATSDFASKLAFALSVAPARRDLLAVKLTDSYSPVFYSSALYAKSWLDPSPKDTNNIFSGMINGVLSGNFSTENAIRDGNTKMQLLLAR